MTATAILLNGAPTISAATAPALGNINSYNASGGALSITLPLLSTTNVGANCIVEKNAADTSTNSVTFTTHSGDTFDDATTSVVLANTGEKRTLQVVFIGGTKYWKITNVSSGSVGAGLGGFVPWIGIPGVLPATSGQHLRTQGGILLDDGSGTLSAPFVYGTDMATTQIQSIHHVVAPAIGALANLGQVIVDSAGTPPGGGSGPESGADAGGIGTAGLASTTADLGGTALAPVGSFWGGWFACATEGGHHGSIYGIEVDVNSMSTSLGIKAGIRICLGTVPAVSGDTVRGTLDDAALQVVKVNGTTSWGTGIKFGTDQWGFSDLANISGSWPFNNTSTIIGTCTQGNGLPANIGIDFSKITFTGPAFKTGPASIAMGEMASAPSTIASTGQIYVASDGSLHYLSPSGTDTRLAAV